MTSCGVALGASVIGNAFWNYASRVLPLTMTAQLVLFETLFALLYSFILAERWPAMGRIGHHRSADWPRLVVCGKPRKSCGPA
ncbi:MAG TPA: hypothetical protein VFS01_11730 [Rhizomicrobium sp.]|nr:hypothetical protein [Rhizomicrobium sp.]